MVDNFYLRFFKYRKSVYFKLRLVVFSCMFDIFEKIFRYVEKLKFYFLGKQFLDVA